MTDDFRYFPLTHVTLREHYDALGKEREKLSASNDRRYTEVAAEREKALKIKEEADKRALELASEIQKYKDEKGNELREQINAERRLYVTRSDLGAAIGELRATLDPSASINEIKATLDPIVKYVAAQQGSTVGRASQITTTQAIIAMAVALAALYAFVREPNVPQVINVSPPVASNR